MPTLPSSAIGRRWIDAVSSSVAPPGYKGLCLVGVRHNKRVVKFNLEFDMNRITLEPGKRGGRPCIRGLRITVYDV